MSKSFFIFFLWIAISTSLFSQEAISGVVYDGDTKKPLSNATVRMGNRNVRTDARGGFAVPFKEGKSLEVSASGYHDHDRNPYDMVKSTDVAVYLVPKPKAKGLEISEKAMGVYEPEFEYLFDFEFIDNLLVVGSYLNRNISDPDNGSSLKNCALTLFDNGEMSHRVLIPDYPQRLRRSAFDELFVQGLDFALLVNEDEGKLSVEEFDLKEYRTKVVPYTVALSSSAFSVQIVREIPQVVHYCYQTKLESHEVIRTARNRAYFSKTFLDYTMLDPEQRALAAALSEAQGFDKELYASYIRANNRQPNFRSQQPYATGVDRDLRPPYTPVYKKDGDVLILDAMNQWIYRHDQRGETLDSVYFQIELPGEELWRIEQDQVNEKLYAIHQKKGVYFIRELDPKTGALSTPMKVAFPFPEKLKIYNGNAFYIRHDADAQFKHLYKESLNFN
ncbi:carboxypeptidase-like regulatory domain-containing protein [Cryomorphaceae bacterium 1068]|nr:carboxypeptidase-like regulatory domain-containing protein [Cryomorphaceae bacterium 1068]